MRGGKSKAAPGGFVERKTGFFLARTMVDSPSNSMPGAAKDAHAYLPDQTLHTLALDNGKETDCPRRIKEDIGLDVYFVGPGCAW